MYFTCNDVMRESTLAQKMKAGEMIMHVVSLDLKHLDEFFISMFLINIFSGFSQQNMVVFSYWRPTHSRWDGLSTI